MSTEDHSIPADVSISGGSDTEAARGQKDAETSQGRTTLSVKKFTTFKAVPINKKFLTKTTAPSPTSKPADLTRSGTSTPPTGSSTLSALRPRLVAKTGSTGRDASPRLSSTVNGGKPGSAPDPAIVWNKNRPVPVPDPKKFTDEELKKYGIHMASRLNEDDANGQGKWADIDDDDEDWAPEAITWGDGTKTAVPQLDDLPLPSARQTNGPPPSSYPGLPEKPNPPTPTVTSTKPMGKGGLVLKGAQQEKPTLVAKPPPPPGPVKSPWAALPPIDKASPAVVEPTQSPASRSIAREPLPQKGASAPVPVPAPKEIAADDFNRSSWRDGSSHGNRELFNSQSGRYEPVHERRGSFAKDHTKHPALLQRTGPTDQPAEPSSAFQTHRMSQDTSFNRRRTSSNVSGGSGTYYRTVKGGEPYGPPPPEALTARRPSIAGSLTSPVAQHAIPAPNLGPHGNQPPQPWGSQPYPASTFANTQHGPANTLSTGGPPQSQPHPQTPHAQPTQDDVEYQKQLMRERNELARKRRQEQEAAEAAARQERIQKKLEAMGPAPPKRSEKSEPHTTRPTHIQQREQMEAKSAPPAGSATPVKEDVALASSPRSQDQRGPGVEQAAPTTAPSNAVGDRRPSHGQKDRSSIWNGPSPRSDRLHPWNSNAPPPTRSVWASTDIDMGLGNGTFNVPTLPGGPGQPSQDGPAPIGSPAAPRQAAPGRSKPSGLVSSRYAAPDLASKWVNAVADNDRKLQEDQLAKKLERDREMLEQGTTNNDAQPVIKDTWRPVSVADGSRINKSPSDGQHPIHGRVFGDNIIHPQQGPPADGPFSAQTPGSTAMLRQTSQGASSSQKMSRFFPSKDIRGDGVSPVYSSNRLSPSPPPPDMEGHPAYDGNVMRPHVSLPKPHPVVKLPPNAAPAQPRQQRVPFAWANPPAFGDVVRGAPPPPPQPLAPQAQENSQKAWQHRFNTLLHVGKLSPPRAVGVEPTSKNALDYMVYQVSATVSLPGKGPIFLTTSGTTSETKPMAEECFDEQEIGSLPRVKMPHKVTEAAWEPAIAQTKPLPRKFLVHPTIMEPYRFTADILSSGTALRIFFPGMEDAKVITLPFSASRGGGGGGGGRGGRGRGSRGRGRGGGDHGYGNADKSDTTSTQGDYGPSKPPRRGRGGGYRGRSSSNWSTHGQSPAPIHA